jgi:hypothetical protein
MSGPIGKHPFRPPEKNAGSGERDIPFKSPEIMVDARERNVFGQNLFLDRIFFHDVSKTC